MLASTTTAKHQNLLLRKSLSTKAKQLSSPPSSSTSSTSTSQPWQLTMNVTNSEHALKTYCAAKGYEKPIYQIVSRDPVLVDTNCYRFKHYVCSVSVNGCHLANGDGFSKRIARKKAAMFGLQRLRVIELNHFVDCFKEFVPGRFKNSAQHRFYPTLEIEEILPIEGALTPAKGRETQKNALEQPSPRSAAGRARANSDPSEMLIEEAIRKLRHFTEEEEEEEKEKKEEKEKVEEGDEEDRKCYEATMYEEVNHFIHDVAESIQEVENDLTADTA